jgi:hypothetical protein
MTVVGPVLYFQTIKAPKWFEWFVYSGLIAGVVCMIIFCLDEFVFIDTDTFLIIPTVICTVVFVPILWLVMKGEFIKKVFLVFLTCAYSAFSFYCIFFSMLFLSMKIFSDENELVECIPVIEYIDYNTNKEFVGSVVVIKYKEMTSEITIPPQEFEKMKGTLPHCVTVRLNKSLFNGFYASQVEW